MKKNISDNQNAWIEKRQGYSVAGTAYDETYRAFFMYIPLELYDAIATRSSLDGREIPEICKLALTQYIHPPTEKISVSQPKRQREKSRYRELIAEGLQNYVDSQSAIREKS